MLASNSAGVLETLHMSYKQNAQGRKERDGFITSSLTFVNAEKACVAVKIDGDLIQVRDTKDDHHTTLSFNRKEWDAFIGGVKLGEFD